MEKWISIAAVTLATTVAACTASQDSFKVQPVLSFDGKPIKDSGASEYQRGKELLSQGRFALAAQAFQTALFAGGSSVTILNALAVSYDKLGRYDLSDRYYQRAFALNPNSPQTVNNLAVSLAQRGASDLAAKVLADAHAQLPNDKTIADNLKLAQEEAAIKPPEVAVATLPVPPAPPVPRIEQASPSTQKLVTIEPHSDARSHQSALMPRLTGGTVDAVPVQSIETQRSMLGDLGSAAVSEKLAVAQKSAANPPPGASITPPSPPTQQTLRIEVSRPDSGLEPAATRPLALSGAGDATTIKLNQAQESTISVPGRRPAVTSVVLAPPPKVGKVESAAAGKIAAVPPLQATGASPTEAVSQQPARETAAVQAGPLAAEPSMIALAPTRLGSRIADSDNILPNDIAKQPSIALELVLGRLGARVEVANGAGRRYMAARMRTFLDMHGFDVAHVTNARSFDHVQTVIVYRDQYQLEALDLAKSLTTKVELVHVPELPVDVRLILGRDLLAFDRTLENGG